MPFFPLLGLVPGGVALLALVQGDVVLVRTVDLLVVAGVVVTMDMIITMTGAAKVKARGKARARGMIMAKARGKEKAGIHLGWMGKELHLLPESLTLFVLILTLNGL